MRLIDADRLKNNGKYVIMPSGALEVVTFEDIDDAPTISDWIPCSEQEPEEDGYYLVCWSDGQIETEWYDNEGWGYCDVVAWMPLPEPYKG